MRVGVWLRIYSGLVAKYFLRSPLVRIFWARPPPRRPRFRGVGKSEGSFWLVSSGRLLVRRCWGWKSRRIGRKRRGIGLAIFAARWRHRAIGRRKVGDGSGRVG